MSCPVIHDEGAREKGVTTQDMVRKRVEDLQLILETNPCADFKKRMDSCRTSLVQQNRPTKGAAAEKSKNSNNNTSALTLGSPATTTTTTTTGGAPAITNVAHHCFDDSEVYMKCERNRMRETESVLRDHPHRVSSSGNALLPGEAGDGERQRLRRPMSLVKQYDACLEERDRQRGHGKDDAAMPKAGGENADINECFKEIQSIFEQISERTSRGGRS